MDAVREKLKSIEKRYNEISDELVKEDVMSDIKKVTKLSKEQARLQGAVDAWHQLESLDAKIEEAEGLVNEDDEELK